ncbi:uncharacterized protein LOC142584276 [Dermacentor variabilis]|uniref:uncharacterized protein LOC142584276 n=1 Tax=Dermacentor variabilis TaxID=34621 RepID=UPI003F5C71CF
MYYLLLVFALATFPSSGVGKKNRTEPTLDDLRNFLNTSRNIYVYSQSLDHTEDEDSNETCTQYQPQMTGSDEYVLHMKFMLNSTWTNATVCAELGTTRFGKVPYMKESAEKGQPGIELLMAAWDPEAGCTFFKYFYSSDGYKCETHVLEEKVESYDKLTNDTCRNYTKNICKNDTRTIYTDSCKLQASSLK